MTTWLRNPVDVDCGRIQLEVETAVENALGRPLGKHWTFRGHPQQGREWIFGFRASSAARAEIFIKLTYENTFVVDSLEVGNNRLRKRALQAEPRLVQKVNLHTHIELSFGAVPMEAQIQCAIDVIAELGKVFTAPK